MNKYNRIMARVTVSEEMKNRVLSSIEAAEPREAAETVRFTLIKRYIALAACFIAVVAGVLAVTHVTRAPRPGGDLTAGAPVEYKSAKALSRASGIKAEELKNLPFTAEKTVYLDYGCNLVEIVYSNGAQSLYYRVSNGSGDNSGDFNEYEETLTKEIRGVTVTLKGGGGLVYCALYEKDGRSYSLGAPGGLTLPQIEAMMP